MSSGRYCVIRDLGPVKGGKGMKHHDVLLTLALSGIPAGLLRLVKILMRDPQNKFTKPQESHH
jgi:hypothetical protein